jgi:hypothetical protein
VHIAIPPPRASALGFDAFGCLFLMPKKKIWAELNRDINPHLSVYEEKKGAAKIAHLS